MCRRLSPCSLSVASLALLTAVVIGGAAQSSASASSFISSLGHAVDVRIGGIVFEVGSRIGLEFARGAGVDCFGSDVTVQSVVLLDAESRSLQRIVYDPSVPIAAWLGAVSLHDPEGVPLSIGAYQLAVETTAGSFTVEFEAAETSRLYRLGSYRASASVCGWSLRVYRMLSEADHAGHLTLRVGDRLLICLEGNPTTGYEWANTLLYEFESLQQLGEVESRPDSGLLGASGSFLFRYEAVASGPQAFRFAYRRPWESVQPLALVEFQVDVR